MAEKRCAPAMDRGAAVCCGKISAADPSRLAAKGQDQPLERAAAKERQAMAGGTAPGKFPEAVTTGQTRDKIGTRSDIRETFADVGRTTDTHLVETFHDVGDKIGPRRPRCASCGAHGRLSLADPDPADRRPVLTLAWPGPRLVCQGCRP
jgi:hypothetical protein